MTSLKSHLTKQQIVLQKLELQSLELENLLVLEAIENLTLDRVLPPRPAIDSLTVSDGEDPVYPHNAGSQPEVISISLDPGSYFIFVSPFGHNTKITPDGIRILHKTNTGLGLPFDLSFDGAGNSLGNARNIGQLDTVPVAQSFSDAVGIQDLTDYYRFDLQAQSEVDLTLNGLTADANIFLLDESGNIITSSENLGNTSDLINKILVAGTYYVLVKSVAPSNNSSTPYTLTLSSQFITHESLVSSPDVSLPDPEYDAGGYRLTWQDSSNNLWVAPIDRKTGKFLLEQAVLVDKGLVASAITSNGPEWAYRQQGAEIAYSKLINGQSFIGRAEWTGSQWKTDVLPGSQGGTAPVATLNASDLIPLVRYFIGSADNPRQQMAWQEFDSSGTKGIVPGNSVVGRWVEGQPSLMLQIEVNGFAQIFKYDLESDVLTQLTFSPTDKSVCFMWKAPEFNNELVFLTKETSSSLGQIIGVYRNINGQWTKIKEIKPPSGLPYLRSPEPFKYNGKSYISLSAINDPATTPSNGDQGAQIWIAGIEAQDFYRKVSGEETDIVRKDPEFFASEAGAFIYYTQIMPNGTRQIYQADTGLDLLDQAGNSVGQARDIGQLDATPSAQTFFDAVNVNDRNDYYRFQLTTTSTVKLDLTGLSANADLILGNAAGNSIASSLQGGNTPEQLTRTLTPGTYTVLVSSVGQSVTNYQLALSAQFVSDETPITNPTDPVFGSLPDTEFDQLNYQVTWQDKKEQLWVAPVDPQSGNFLFAQAVPLDTGLAPIPSFRQRTGTGNGPEWTYTATGTQILYTKALGKNQYNWYIYRARQTGTGWIVEPLPNTSPLPQGNNGLTPIGTLTPGDPNPRVNYVTPTPAGDVTTLAWRDLNQSNGAIVSTQATSAGRWVGGKGSALVYTQAVSGIDQVFLYDTTAKTSTQMTSSATAKDDPFVWEAPEYDGQPLLMVVERVTGQPTSVGIYQQDAQGNWLKINTVRPPTTRLNLRSVEPFVFNSRSYLSFVAEDFKGAPSDIWIAGIDANAPFYRQVSNPNVSLVRNDPETLITESGVQVYYTESGSRTVYRASTGLPLPNIVGTSSADTLTGTPANDRITGLGGADTLTGTQGKDSFVYQSIGDAGDTIADFTVGQDKIVLTDLFQSLGYTGTTPNKDGYLRVIQPPASGALVQIDPDGRAGSQTWIALLQTSGVSAIALNSPDNFVF